MSGITHDLTFYDGPGTDEGQVVGVSATSKVGFYGTTPVAQPALPVTLADVIAIMVANGLCKAS